MSEQQVISMHRDLCRPYRMPRTERCEVCNKEVERNPDNGKWYFEGYPGEECVLLNIGGAYLCSEKCRSQHLYNIGTPQDRELLCALARYCELWRERMNPSSHRWRVEHLHAGLMVDGSDLQIVDEQIEVICRGLTSEDYINGKDDPPAWYCNAAKDIWNPPAPSVGVRA